MKGPLPSSTEMREMLEAARSRIADIDRWAQNVEACDEEGNSLIVQDPGACRWSADGALDLATRRNGYGNEVHDAALRALSKGVSDETRARDPRGPVRSPANDALALCLAENDFKSPGGKAADHARVMAMFDRAIEILREADG